MGDGTSDLVVVVGLGLVNKLDRDYTGSLLWIR